jgi:hypothetical protein
LDNRAEKRVPVESINLPVIGTREADHACFEYLLLELSAPGARAGLKFAIPEWVVQRELIKERDLVNFHLPFRVDGSSFHQGTILWTKWDEESRAQIYGAALIKETRAEYPVCLSIKAGGGVSIDLTEFASSEELVIMGLKEMELLKRGVLVYMGHLVPYFSRVSGYPGKIYPAFSRAVMKDSMARLEANARWLKRLREGVQSKKFTVRELPRHVDLEELRSVAESEISIDVFTTVFDTGAHLPYLGAIAQLEKKIYYNYNMLVLIYLRSILPPRGADPVRER